MRNLRLVIGTVVYFLIVAALLIFFHYQFSGFTGWIVLFVLAFLSHASTDYVLKKITKKKENDTNV